MSDAVVAVVAHPDDESLIAGGTLALAAQAGAATGVVTLTRGEQGPINDNGLTTRARLGDERERELRAAARELGVSWVVCLRHPDGELPWVDHEAVAEELAALLAEHGATAVLTFGEDGLYWHHDHIAAGEIAARAVRGHDPAIELYESAWPTGLMSELVAAALERGLPADLWGLDPAAFGTDRAPTAVIDIRAALPRKVAAIRAHRSQIGPDHLLAALPDDLAQRFLAVERWVGPYDGQLEELIGRG